MNKTTSFFDAIIESFEMNVNKYIFTKERKRALQYTK